MRIQLKLFKTPIVLYPHSFS